MFYITVFSDYHYSWWKRFIWKHRTTEFGFVWVKGDGRVQFVNASQ